MRVRTLIDRLGWLAALGFLGYTAIVGGTAYLETRQLVDQAVFEAGKRPRAAAAMGQPGAGVLQQFASDTREAILLAARRSNVPIESAKLTVSPEGNGIRVSLHWSYVMLVVADETALAIPLWLDRSFELKP